MLGATVIKNVLVLGLHVPWLVMNALKFASVHQIIKAIVCAPNTMRNLK